MTVSLEEMIGTCVTHGVRCITLSDYGCEPGYGEYFCLELHDRYPWRIFDVPKPWTIEPFWVGFGEGQGLRRLIPFDVCWDFWRLALYDRKARLGVHTARLTALEEDFLGGLGNFVCDDQGRDCPHTICEFHGTCDDD